MRGWGLVKVAANLSLKIVRLLVRGRIWEWEPNKRVEFITPTKHTPQSIKQKLVYLTSLLLRSFPAVPCLGSASPTAECSTRSSPPLHRKVKSRFLCQVSLPMLTPKWFLSPVSDTLKNKMYLVWYRKQSENHKGPEITWNVKMPGPNPPVYAWLRGTNWWWKQDNTAFVTANLSIT